MSQLIYSPLGALNQLHRDLARVFDGDASGEPSTYDTSSWIPSIDIREEESGFLVLADVPGVDPRDVDITLDRNVLTIRGERSTEREEEEGGFKRRERISGSFVRQFTLPDSADAEGITAKVNNGVLELRIPKGERNQPRSITVS